MTERTGHKTILRGVPCARRLDVGVALVAAVLTSWFGPAVSSARAMVAEPAATRALALRSIEASILDRINATRRASGLRVLRLAAGLERAAGSHARTLAVKGVFSHEVGGVSPSTRIRRFYRGSAVGEVLLWRSPTLTSEQALSAWLASPPHRSIILSGRYSDVGLAVRAVSSAPGYYGGRPVTIVVADLGAR